MESRRDIAEERRIVGQGRILEALAGGDVLTGTLERLGRRFELAPDDLRTGLRELVRAGWVVVQTQPFGRLTVRIERRSHLAAPPPTGDRRGPRADAWEL
jgi:hypothetical protein